MRGLQRLRCWHAQRTHFPPSRHNRKALSRCRAESQRQAVGHVAVRHDRQGEPDGVGRAREAKAERQSVRSGRIRPRWGTPQGERCSQQVSPDKDLEEKVAFKPSDAR
jgi:hypothetical protein